FARLLSCARTAPEIVKLQAQLARLPLGKPRRAPPLALPHPGGNPADQHAGNDHGKQQCKQRQGEHECRLSLIERIKRDGDRLPVCDREAHEDNRQRQEDDEEDGLADHGLSVARMSEAKSGVHLIPHFAALMRATSNFICPQGRNPGYAGVDGCERLSRSRISLPVLKNGADFFSTETCAPVRGLRPVRAGRFFTEKAPKPRSSTRSPRAMAAVISPRIALMMFST